MAMALGPAAANVGEEQLIPLFEGYYEKLKNQADGNVAPIKNYIQAVARNLEAHGVGNGVHLAAKQVLDDINHDKDMVQQRDILLSILRDELDARGIQVAGRKSRRRANRGKKTRKQRRSTRKSRQSRKH
jgi:hypothetical protein